MVTSPRCHAPVLTAADLEELEAKAMQQGETIYRMTEFGAQENLLPQILGAGSDRIFQLRHGLSIRVRNCELSQTVRFESLHDSSMPLVAKFHLSGNSRVLTPNVKEINPDYVETAGHHYK
ncbi:MAG: hypothetical protein F6K19_48555 [Cyanothece sp. SIO1E1]|nr:hypothetical protein [Cyanothece sp. SIO1E1]